MFIYYMSKQKKKLHLFLFVCVWINKNCSNKNKMTLFNDNFLITCSKDSFVLHIGIKNSGEKSSIKV